jgi:hypothetical protein
MGDLDPSEERIRGRVESLIRLMAPALDAVLAAGERISRIVEPEDHGYYPPRPLQAEGEVRNRESGNQGRPQPGPEADL